jgi:hypothetical protein
MKTLMDYAKEELDELFKRYGFFYAFSDEQFKKGMVDNGIDDPNDLVYIKGLMGYCHRDKADEFIEGYNNVLQNAIEKDKKENGIENIIRRELFNHEAQISRSIEDTVDALDGYGISSEMVADYYKNVFFPYCLENDLF